MVIRVDRASRVVVDAQGLVRGVIRREGVLIYQRADGGETREYVPSNGLEASLVSLAGSAVTVAHPAGGVASARDAVGAVVDGRVLDGAIVATLRIDASHARRAIDSGKLVELSCGYRCDVLATPGTSPSGERYDAVQVSAIFDHVALLPRAAGRCGAACSLRGDAITTTAAPCACSKEALMEPKTDDVDTKGRFSSAMDRTPQTLQGSDPPEKLPPMEEALVLLRRIAAAVGGTSAGTERPEGLAPIGLARVASIKGDALDVGQLVQARVALEAQARSLSPTVRCDGTDAELVRAALKAAGEVVEGNADYLAGKLAGVVSGRGARALGEARGSVGHHTDEAVPPATLGQMMSGAWRR